MSKPKTEYTFVPGRQKKIPAQVIGEALEKFVEKDLDARSAALVRAATDKRHPMHIGFTWDDTEAGRKLRLLEAREYFTCVSVVSSEPTGEVATTIAFVSVRDEEGNRAYQKASDALVSVRVQADALRDLIGQLNGLVRRYGQFASCKPIVDVIKRILRKQEVA